MSKTVLLLLAFLGLACPLLAQSVEPGPVGALLAQATPADIARVGPVDLGMTEGKVSELVGPPESVSKPVLSPATALFNKESLYPKLGVAVTFAAPELEGPYTVESLVLTAPNCWMAANGISVGMLQTEAYNRFKALLTEDINALDQINDTSFGVLVMSTYTVLSASCEGGVVKQIYLGPGPE